MGTEMPKSRSAAAKAKPSIPGIPNVRHDRGDVPAHGTELRQNFFAALGRQNAIVILKTRRHDTAHLRLVVIVDDEPVGVW